MGQDSGRRWRTAFFALLLISILFCGWLAYQILDQGVTLTYMEEGYSQTERDMKIVLGLLPRLAGKAGRKDIIFLLRQQNPGAFITEEGAEVRVEQLRFLFDPEGTLVEVVGLNN